MRSIAVAGLALATLLGVATTEPAAAWDDGRYRGTGLYIHHHVYYPGAVRNVYHVYRPGPYHMHVVADGGGAPYVWYNAKPYYGARYYWRWRSPYGHYRRW